MIERIYTFNIFDTLITRTTYNSSGVFAIVQKKLREKYGSKLDSFFVDNYVGIRILSEKMAREAAYYNHNEEIEYDEIFSMMSDRFGIDDCCCDWLKKTELNIEKNVSLPIRHNIEKLREIIQKEKVYLIDYTYHDEAFIKELLIMHDEMFAKIPIIISSRYKKAKRNGSLYKFFFERYIKDEIEWMHFGSKSIIDRHRCIKNEGDSLLLPSPTVTLMEKRILDELGCNVSAEIMLKVITTNRNDEHMYYMGMSVAVPLLFGYVYWIIDEVKKSNCNNIYFVQRDGYILKIIADCIIKHEKLKIHTKYIYGSRFAWRLPKECNRSSIVKAIRNSNSIEEIKDLLLGDDIWHYIEGDKRKLYSSLTAWDKRELNCVKIELITNVNFLKTIEKNLKARKKRVMAYIKQELDEQEQEYYFVELNGTGFTQSCLTDIIGNNIKKVTTFYYNMSGRIRENKRVFFKQYMRYQVKCPDLVEAIARAPFGMTTDYYYDKKDNIWKPELSQKKDYFCKSDYTAYSKGIHDSTLQLCNFIEHFSNQELLEISLRYYRELTTNPDRDKFQYISNVPFGVDDDGIMYGYAQAFDINEHMTLELYKKKYPNANYDYLKVGIECGIINNRSFSNEGERIHLEEKSFERNLVGKIALYGAGKVGRNMYKRLLLNPNVEIVAWFDKLYNRREFDSRTLDDPKKVSDTDFDFCIIAVNDYDMMYEIRKALTEQGVPKHKII